MSSYLLMDASDTHGDVSLTLTPLELKLCKHFVSIIVGKRGRRVPVLLTPLRELSRDALTKTKECGVLCDNESICIATFHALDLSF